MVNRQSRPSFFASWLDDLTDDVRRRGPKSLIPWTAIFCIIVGVCVAIAIPEGGSWFWDKPEVSLPFFTAIITIDGLLLAFSWVSFSKIYEIASRPALARFLRRHKMLDSYVFHVDFIHFAQITALSFSGIALTLCVVKELPAQLAAIVPLIRLQQVALAACVASSIYAFIYALGAVRMMQDLVWYSSDLPGDQDVPVQEVKTRPEAGKT
jgi:hypothetical protein